MPRCSGGLPRQGRRLETTLAHRPGIEWRADRSPPPRRPSSRLLLRYAHPGTRLREPAMDPRQSMAYERCPLTETVKDVPGPNCTGCVETGHPKHGRETGVGSFLALPTFRKERGKGGAPGKRGPTIIFND